MNGILPFEPPQVDGFTAVPSVSVGVVGSVRVAVPEADPVHPLKVIENPEYDPAESPDKVNAPEATVMLAVLAVPSL